MSVILSFMHWWSVTQAAVWMNLAINVQCVILYNIAWTTFESTGLDCVAVVFVSLTAFVCQPCGKIMAEAQSNPSLIQYAFIWTHDANIINSPIDVLPLKINAFEVRMMSCSQIQLLFLFFGPQNQILNGEEEEKKCNLFSLFSSEACQHAGCSSLISCLGRRERKENKKKKNIYIWFHDE